MLDKIPAESCVVYLTSAEPDMCKKYFCPRYEKDKVLVYHMKIHRLFESISYHTGVLNNIQNEKTLWNEQVKGLRKSLNYWY